MPYRDANGHFCSREEAIRQSTFTPEPDEDTEEEPEVSESTHTPEFGETSRSTEQVMVDTGRGNAVPVNVGADFKATLERLADEHNYGGYYRVFLNGNELVDPADAPAKIEAGMRIAITSYDKVG